MKGEHEARRDLVKWALTLGLAVLLALSPTGSATAGTTAQGLYLALGDSLAVGVGATDPGRLGYAPRLSREGSPQLQVSRLVNLARGGETSATFIAGGQLASAVAASADQTTEVLLVTLDIGGNDLLALLATPDSPCAADPQGPPCGQAVAAALAHFAPNYATILATLQQALEARPGGGHLAVMTYYNPWSGTGSPHEAAADAALLGSDRAVSCAEAVADPATGLAPVDLNAGLNDLITCIGLRYGATVADVYPHFAGKGQALTHIASGDIHPTDAGYLAIADAFQRALK